MKLDAEKIISSRPELEKGLGDYWDIMKRFKATRDVCKDEMFKRAFNGFYKVRRHKEKWQRHFYQVFELLRTGNREKNFWAVLMELWWRTGRVEASFVSKMFATLDKDFPIIDKYVLINTGLGEVRGSGEVKIENATRAYGCLKQIVDAYIQSDDGRRNITVFDRHFPEYERKISSVKKIDFLLWAKR